MTALTLLALAASIAAPVPKDFKAKLAAYFPLNNGDEWVYRIDTLRSRVVATGVAVKGGVTTGELVTYDGDEGSEREATRQTLRIDNDGVHCTHMNGKALTPPYTVLSFDPKRENKWQAEGELDGKDYLSRWEIVGKEDVEVPAGKFTAVRVTMSFTVGKLPIAAQLWYAEGVGQVKMTNTGIKGEIVQELRSYTRGKEAKK